MVLLFLVAALGGALNAVGGGATFLVFPALVFAGVDPLAANVTASVALFPASIATSLAYRRELSAPGRVIAWLVVASVIGTVGGAITLLSTPIRAFTHLVPYLLLLASLIFTFGVPRTPRPSEAGVSVRALLVVSALHVAVGFYGGYFGAGMGILMLAQLSALGIGDIHRVNALRSVLTMVINAVAVLIFVEASAVAWRQGVVMMVGAVAGGYGGASLVRRVDARLVRRFVIIIAWGMTVIFFARKS